MKNTIYISLAMSLMITTACNSKNSEQSTTENGNKMEEKEMSLAAALTERKTSFAKKADENTKKIYKEGFDDLSQSGILAAAKNVGDKAPNFSLKNALGKEVSLEKSLENGPVVLVWYRGGWCPYCNLNLHYLQEELTNIKAEGATLLALTPELPDESISTSEKHHLEFEVLSDVHNKVAKEYGVVFKLTDDVAKIYNEKFGLNEHNGDTSNELPLAVTYIIDTDGTIAYAFLDFDYRNRAEPTEITAFLKNMK